MKLLLPCVLAGLLLITIPLGAYASTKPDLFNRAASALIAARSLSADFTATVSDGKGHTKYESGRITLMKPNYVRLDVWTISQKDQPGARRLGLPHEIRASDGTYYWHILPDGVFTKTEADLQTVDDFDDFAPFSGFFDSWKLFGINSPPKLRLSGTRQIDGVPCKVYAMTGPKGQVAFGPDHMMRLLKLDGPQPSVITLRHVKMDTFLSERAFAIKRPKFAVNLKKELNPTLTARNGGGYMEMQLPEVLANGKTAPDFTVYDRRGKAMKLSDYRGRVVVLDYWATWCGACEEAMPHTNAVAAKFKNSGVVVLAVNVMDTKDAFLHWLPGHKQYNAMVFAIDPADPGQDAGARLYNVTGYPTQIVIGKDGKVVKSFVGYGGPTNDLAKAIKGAL